MKKIVVSSVLASLVFACSEKPTSHLQSEPEAKFASRLGLNDLAILMPLDTLPELINVLPRLTDVRTKASEGETGYVYSWTEAERNRRLSTQTFTEQMQDFVMTSIRIDPCSNRLQTEADDSKCIRELRIVWQKLKQSLRAKPVAVPGDSSVHTLYSLSNDEFSSLISKLKTLHSRASLDTFAMPLLPQPVIAKEGVSSPYLLGCLEAIKLYAKPERLSEIAMFAERGTYNWGMAHLAVKDGAAFDFEISMLVDKQGQPMFLQSVNKFFSPDFNTTGSQNEFTIPALPVAPGTMGALPDVETIRRVISKKIPNGYAIENPTLHNTRNTDCGNCHLASKQPGFMKIALDQLKGDFPAIETFQTHQFHSTRWNLEARFPESATSLQIFSFTLHPTSDVFVPVIGPRVINDTAMSLDYLETIETSTQSL